MSELEDALKRNEEVFDPTWDESMLFAEAARQWAAVQKAITNEGPQPRLHRKIMRRHKKEWPTLWAALGITTEDE